MAKRRAVYLFCLLACALFALVYWDYIGAVLLWFTLLLPLPLFAVNWIASRFVRVGLETASLAAVRGTPSELRIYIDNNSIFPISTVKLTVRMKNRFDPDNGGKEILVFPAAASDRTLLTLKTASRHCGPVELTIEKVKLCDWLGLTSVSKRCRLRAELAVLPEVFAWTGEGPEAEADHPEGAEYAENKRGDDPSQIFDYHEYREGDRLKDIHWKLSARLDRLMVKEFSLPVSSAVAIALEFSGDGGPAALDRTIAAAASASARLWALGLPHDLLWYSSESGVRRLPIQGESDFFAALGEIYRENPYTGRPLLTELALKEEHTPYAQLYYAACGTPSAGEEQGCGERAGELSERLVFTVLQPPEADERL